MTPDARSCHGCAAPRGTRGRASTAERLAPGRHARAGSGTIPPPTAPEAPLTTRPTPAGDGWWVELHDPGSDTPREARPFALAEDAREFAKAHVFTHRADVAHVVERRGGAVVFRTRIAHPLGPGGA